MFHCIINSVKVEVGSALLLKDCYCFSKTNFFNYLPVCQNVNKNQIDEVKKGLTRCKSSTNGPYLNFEII